MVVEKVIEKKLLELRCRRIDKIGLVQPYDKLR